MHIWEVIEVDVVGTGFTVEPEVLNHLRQNQNKEKIAKPNEVTTIIIAAAKQAQQQ